MLTVRLVPRIADELVRASSPILRLFCEGVVGRHANDTNLQLRDAVPIPREIVVRKRAFEVRIRGEAGLDPTQRVGEPVDVAPARGDELAKDLNLANAPVHLNRWEALVVGLHHAVRRNAGP